MQGPQPSLIARDDTFLGICQAVGEDFGFNPNWLRIAFGVPLIFSPMMVLAAYFGLGAIVLISRILAPRPRRKVAVQPVEAVEAATSAPEAANRVATARPMPLLPPVTMAVRPERLISNSSSLV